MPTPTLTDVVSAAVALARRPRADVQIIGAEPQLRRFHSLALAERHAAVVPLFKRALDVAIEQDMQTLKTRWLSRPLRAEVMNALARRYGPWVAGVWLLLAGLWWWHIHCLRTEVRRTQQAQQMAQAVGAQKARFTTFLAHEVRNSLHAVIAGTELAQTPGHGGPATDVLVGESARSTLRLLNNLIDRDRLDAGRLPLHPDVALLASLVQAVVREMTPAAELSGLTFKVSVPDADPSRLLDPLRLQQVLRNLLANAIKYGAPKASNERDGQDGKDGEDGRAATLEIQVEVEVLPADTAHPGRVAIEVRDRGPGVAAADMAQLFERYGAAQRVESSAGLGLPISRELARLMGGDLQLLRRAGGGTVVRLYFQAPLAAVADATTPAVPDQPMQPLQVLLVEDAEVFAILLARAFEQRGHAVQVVGTLAAARQRLLAGGVQLLLCDLHLPDGRGAELLQWAHSSLPAPGPLLLAMTADPDTAVTSPVELAGVRALLQKTGDAAGLAERALREAGARS